MPEANETMGHRLRHARERRGLGSRELARRAGVNEAYPSQIEGGFRTRIEAATLAKLAGALEVSLDWLVNGGPEPPLSKFADVEEAPADPVAAHEPAKAAGQ